MSPAMERGLQLTCAANCLMSPKRSVHHCVGRNLSKTRFFRKVASVASLLLLPVFASADLYVVIAEGLGGDADYATDFAAQVEQVASASATMTSDDKIKVFQGDDVSRDAILAHLSALTGQADENDQFAIYLIGHGSYDDFNYKFNIAGPDLTDEDILGAMEALPGNNQLLVNTSSASGAMKDQLASDSRLVVLATRSGVERHATRFGSYFAAALNDPAADLNKNQVISVQEAFGFAERQVVDYFERSDRLATEHAVLEGDRSDRFGISRLREQRRASGDAALGALTADRDALNTQIDELRLSRDQMALEDYQSELLGLMLELAATEDDIERRENELGIGAANGEN